jgi:DNA-binding NarL/FixJ family response regulator
MAVSVLIVDDHPKFRASARRLLELDGFQVVGEAPDAMTALALARKLQPDVVLLDIALPDASGFDVAERLRGTSSAIVLVSSRDPADFGPKLGSVGAAGFIPKERLTAAAVRGLLRGQA